LLHMPTAYTATGILLYDPNNIPGTQAAPQVDAANEDAITASQSAVIASLPAAQAIAAQLNLASLPEFNPALSRPFWPLRLFIQPHAPGPDALAQSIRRSLSVANLPGSRILTVSFTSTNPSLAADTANLAMQLYLAHEREQSFAALTDAQSWLESHSADVQSQLNATETSLAKASAAAGVVEAQADLAMNQARLSTAASGDAASANAAIAPNLLPLRKEQADLTAQVQSMQGEYGPDYPDLRSARTQLSAITAEINAETERELDAAHAEVAADQAEIATLRAALGAARSESVSEDEESAPIRALEQRAEAGRDMLRSMTLQAAQLAQDASLTRPDARILSAAAPPSSPSTPHRSLILAAAALLGLCSGLLLAGLADALDTSFRSGADIRAALDLSCLALLPEVANPQRAALEAPFSLFSEQLRALQTGLGLVPRAGKIIAITAARPGEGKTTLTIAFARALANAGLNTLAIDGDIRQPSFDFAFHAAGMQGLTDHLAGLTPLDDILRPDPLSPLTIIPAGTQARAALSLFLSPALPGCLEKLRKRYDVVLLDVPPAFALAEGRVLARLADTALVCVRWGHTPSRVVLAAIQLLREAGVTISGAALTRVNVKAHGRSGFADAEIYQPRYGGYFKG